MYHTVNHYNYKLKNECSGSCDINFSHVVQPYALFQFLMVPHQIFTGYLLAVIALIVCDNSFTPDKTIREFCN